MHIGRRVGNVAERGSFECAFIAFDFGFVVAAQVRQIAFCIHAGADVVKLSIGEERKLLSDRVARDAVRFILVPEYRQSSDWLRR